VHIDVVNEEELRIFLEEHGYKVIKTVSFDNVKKIAYVKVGR